MKKLQFKPHFQVEVVRPNTVYLLSEESSIALTGNLYCQLAPFLNGNYTLDEITARLPEVDPDRIYYAINKLKTKYLIEKCDRPPHHMSAFWSSLNLDPEIAWQRLQQAVVSITSYGDVPTDSLTTTLESLGVRVQSSISNSKTTLAVVLTDDYLRLDLEQFNQKAIAAGIPWMLVKPVGTKLWLGPIFVPEQTGCWQCLAQRLTNNREVISTICQQNQTFISTSVAILPSTLQTGTNLAATEIVKWIVKDEDSCDCSKITGKIITLNSINLDLQTHVLTKRPQCPVCGDTNRDRQPQKITLSSQKKQFTIDGGHRIFSPEQTLNRWQHHISPITGVVSALVRTSEPGSNHSYLAVHNIGKATDLQSLRHNLHNKAAGKGRTESQAKASGFCEAIERYSGLFQGDEVRANYSYSELESAIHPANCLQFSPNQYQHRQVYNRAYSGVDFVPQPFNEEREIDWTPVWSLSEQTFKHMSTALCYYKYPLSVEHQFGGANSNGNAAGNTIEEAILQGFMELVERDAVAIWWYNRLQRPLVDLDSFQDPYLSELQTYYRQREREFWVLDLTSDLGIPVFAAVSRRTQGKELIVGGYGAHLDPKIAMMRAVTEMNQFLSRVEIQYPHRLEAGLYQWLTDATIADRPYLVPDSQATSVYTDYAQCWSDDLREDVLHCVAIAKEQNLETLVLDQTRPDIGLNVVKVIVPGLRHFLPRFAPGRLYDVPVKMGWLSEPLSESQMNPIPMPF